MKEILKLRSDSDLVKTLSNVQAKFMVISFTSDWRFSPARSREIVQALLRNRKTVSYVEIDANQGHDAFLMPIPDYMAVFHAYMKQVSQEMNV
ncbi:MAG: hypothetical protein HC831_23240 [Chloroflexia bacterium]|nr:hypothetical protein [Chloroflexia bacterium]